MVRRSREIRIGNIGIGGDNPVAIQAMCTAKTHDVDSTVDQILALQRQGCQIIRVAIPDGRAADAIPAIKARISIPLIADIHFSHKLAIQALERGADKIRINPGNIGGEGKTLKVIEAAKVPIRIGINAGFPGGGPSRQVWPSYRPCHGAIRSSLGQRFRAA